MIDFNSNSNILILEFLIVAIFAGCVYMFYMCCNKKVEHKEDLGYEPIK